MALASSGWSTVQTPQALDPRRRSDRRTCNLPAMIITVHGEIRVRIYNLSAGGVGVTTDPIVVLRPGETFLLRQDQLGEIPCIVRWSMHPRFGAEFTGSGAALTAVNLLYDQLPHSADPSA